MRNLIGLKFGIITIIKQNGRNKNKSLLWIYRCDCGNEKITTGSNVVNTKSCGCLGKEKTIKRNKLGLTKTHGMTKTRFYNIWNKIKNRCNDKNNKRYKNYGGRGIKNEWKSFDEFKIDMYESYLGHQKNNDYTSIDRIDNNGNYCKENCRWATRKEQANNTSRNILITYKGKTQNMTQWSKELGISYNSIIYRYKMNKKQNKLFSKIKLNRWG